MGAVTKAFKSGNSVAVRLPKDVGVVAGTEFEVEEAAGGVFLRKKPKYTGRDLVEALEKLPIPKTKMKRVRISFPKRDWGRADPD